MRTARKAMLALWFVATAVGACLGQSANPKAVGDVDVQIAGTWRGNSVCLVKGSACHDEVNVYRFSKLAGRSGAFSVTASKVTADKEIVMGSGQWTYDASKHVVESKAPSIRMAVDGNRMEGDLTLADGTVYRHISLKKNE
jgi:hypothetical protein